MSCICEFHTPGLDSPENLTPGLDSPENPTPGLDSPQNQNNDDDDDSLAADDSPKDAEPEELTEPSVADSTVSASELADCRAENWLLRKKLREYEVTIENLEQLVSTLVEKQHQILSDMFNLRTENHELQKECNLQREYHTMERNDLLKQLNDAQLLYQNRAASLKSSITTQESRRSNNKESPINSESSFVESSDNEDDQCDSDSNEDDRESNSGEEKEEISGDSLEPSSDISSPISESEDADTDQEDDDESEENSDTDSDTD